MKFIDPKIENYCVAHSWKTPVLLDELSEYTRENFELPQMMIGKMEASFLAFLITSHNVQSILEIGTFTGYSSLSMAYALPKDGKVITIELDENHLNAAKHFAKRSPHFEKINYKLGQAINILPEINEKFDLVFIDADKVNYKAYFELSLEKLNSGGIIVLDNMLWGGSVLEEKPEDQSTLHLKELNDYISQREDLVCSLAPIRDGLMLVTKK